MKTVNIFNEMWACAGVLLVLLSRVAAIPSLLQEEVEGVGETSKFATDPVAFEKKLARSVEFLKHCPDRSQGPQQDFTREEVARYNGVDRDLYLIIDNLVYDFEEFSQYHPAGPKSLQKHAGQDASTAVKMSGMTPAQYRPFLKYFLVGKIVASQMDNSTATQALKGSIESNLDLV